MEALGHPPRYIGSNNALGGCRTLPVGLGPVVKNLDMGLVASF